MFGYTRPEMEETMKQMKLRTLSVLLSLALLASLTAPALASQALGDDLTATDTLLNQQTQLSTNVFWSTTYSDYQHAQASGCRLNVFFHCHCII